MNITYVRSVLSHLNIAARHVANKNKDKFYPILTKNVDDMNKMELKKGIRDMIMYLQAPEFSYLKFRDYYKKE